MNVRVTALINDTVGTLVAHAYANPHARIGFIFATGVNAAYPEKIRNIHKLGAEEIKKYGGDNADAEMLINTEIDIYGNESYLPLTKYDRELDAHHSQPGFQPYEKMLSGAYLGEITRIIAIDFIREGHLFGGVIPKGWETAWSFATAQMGTLER
jgi:hexokinase